MKFVISTQELNYLLSKCLSIVSQKPSVPILGNVLIEAVNDELILTATDLKVGVRCYTDAKILEEGGTALPVRRLAQLARELTAANLELTTGSNETTVIVANSSRFKLNGMDRRQFPALPTLDEAIEIKLPQADLKEVLLRTSFAVSREDSRYVLTGVFLSIAEGRAVFAGTDGKRLARIEMAVNVDSAAQGIYIIPLKAVEEIQKGLLDEGEATLYLMKDKIAVQANQVMIVAKLLVGEYPDIERVIPQNCAITVSLHREELMTLLRQISLFVPEDSNSVRFSFTTGEVTISANTKNIGEGNVSMPVNYQGNRLEVAFNPGFFLDILRHCYGETVTLGITDAFNPGKITDDYENVGKAELPLYVLMPMRLNEDS